MNTQNAAFCSTYETVSFLLQRGADPDVTEVGMRYGDMPEPSSME